MGHQSYILLSDSEEERVRILDAIRTHNEYEETATREVQHSPDFEYEVGEELCQIECRRLLKSTPKRHMWNWHFVAPEFPIPSCYGWVRKSKNTHVILCGNGGGRDSTIKWFAKNNIRCVPYDNTSSKWVSKKIWNP